MFLIQSNTKYKIHNYSFLSSKNKSKSYSFLFVYYSKQNQTIIKPNYHI